MHVTRTPHPTRPGGRRALSGLAAAGLAVGLTGLATPSAQATVPAPVVDWGPRGSITQYEGDLTTVSVNGLHMAMSRDGSRAVAVWQRITEEAPNPENLNSDKEVWGSWATITNGVATWAPAHELSNDFTVGRDPDVSMSADGSVAFAAWEDEGGGNSALVSASVLEFSGGTATWNDSFTAIDADVMSPDVALSADGSTVLIATQSTTDGGPIYGTVGVLTPDGAAEMGALNTLSDPGTQSYAFSADISADGVNGIVAWNQSDATDTIRAAAWTSEGWSGTEGGTQISVDGAWTGDPHVSLADDGRGIISWMEYAEDTAALAAPVSFPDPWWADYGAPNILGWASGTSYEDMDVTSAISDDGQRAMLLYGGVVNGVSNVTSAFGRWSNDAIDWTEYQDLAVLLSGDTDGWGGEVALSADHSTAVTSWTSFNDPDEMVVGAVADTSGTTTVWDGLGADAAPMSNESTTTWFNGVAASTDGSVLLSWWIADGVPQWKVGTAGGNEPPTITSSSVANGRSYSAPPALTCRATEPAGGPVACKITTRIIARTTSWTTYRYTITARGSTGLTTTATGTYKVKPFYIKGLRPDSRGIYTLVLGRSYAFIANTPTRAPRYYLAVKAGAGLARVPGPAAGLFKPLTGLGWVVYIHPDKAMLGPTVWNIGARTPDGVMHILHVRVVRPLT